MRTAYLRIRNAICALRGRGPVAVFRWEDTPIGWFDSGALRHGATR